MPYIKISDPNIIDLAAWQQVINVVNQHSDSITAITNNFGIQGSGVTDWAGETEIADEFNSGSQKIIYGRYLLDTTTASDTNGDLMYYADIDFVNGISGTTAFSAKPIVTATATFGSTATPPPINNAGIICTVINVQPHKFTIRVINARNINGATPVKLTGRFNISWMAIGPK
jgi:hypothetical protein